MTVAACPSLRSIPRVIDSQHRNEKHGQDFQIRPAHVEDVPVILQLIRDSRDVRAGAPDEVTATEETTCRCFYSGKRPAAESAPRV